MEAALERQVLSQAGTISMEKWDNLHTVEELDASLKELIRNHFHA